MRILYVFILLIGAILLWNEEAKAQIPASGHDFPTLKGLHWDMTIQEARDYFSGKRKLKYTTSSIVSYTDTLMNTEAVIYLKFIEKNSLLVLHSIEAPLSADNDILQLIENYFINRYGNNYERQIIHKGIDGEKKVWNLNGERIELEILTYNEKIVNLCLTYTSPKIKHTGPKFLTPIQGFDFPTLRNLQWGMTMQAAQKSICGKTRIIDSTSSELFYEDTLLNTKTKITLKFDDCNSLSMLYAIQAEITSPTQELFHVIEKLMTERYGSAYKMYRDSKSKFFFTIYLEAKTWSLNNECIKLVTIAHGDEVKTLKILYEYVDSKQ